MVDARVMMEMRLRKIVEEGEEVDEVRKRVDERACEEVESEDAVEEVIGIDDSKLRMRLVVMGEVEAMRERFGAK